MFEQYYLHILYSQKIFIQTYTYFITNFIHLCFKLPKLSYFFFSEEILVRECRNTSTTSTPVEEMVEVCQDPDDETTITDADDGACSLR
jgi:hypothetical protein